MKDKPARLSGISHGRSRESDFERTWIRAFRRQRSPQAEKPSTKRPSSCGSETSETLRAALVELRIEGQADGNARFRRRRDDIERAAMGARNLLGEEPRPRPKP
jgi:hypothetical protein